MPNAEHTLVKRVLAGLIFMMAFLLTPRAWVDAETSRTSAAVPVQILERQDCLWCAPVQPVDCDDTPAQERPRLWLNPDEPPPEQEATPCVTPKAPKPELVTLPSA